YFRPMKLYRTQTGPVVEIDNTFHELTGFDWDTLINSEDLTDRLSRASNETSRPTELLAPIGTQEVWAAGVTYLRSRDARMEEAKDAGGGDFYQKVYDAERPELFFKALPHRVSAHKQDVYIRKDSSWNVPEPELTLYINSKGEIEGYTIGNDISS